MNAIEGLLASLLNPNPGVQRAGLLGPNAMAQTGLGPEQLARYHQMSGLGGGQAMPTPRAAPSAPSMPQATPQAPDMTQTASTAPAGGGIGGMLQGLFNPKGAGKNRTVQLLMQDGLDEGTATLVAQDKGSLNLYLRQRAFGGDAKQSEFAERAQAAQQYGLSGDAAQQFVLTGKLPEDPNMREDFGLNPIYGKDKDGNIVVMQPSKSGGLVQANVPEGVTLQPGVDKIDLGTEWGITDRSGMIIQRIPKDLAGAEAQKAAGGKQGDAAFDLPRVEQNAEQTLGILERMKTHPGRTGSTGFIQGALPARSSDQLDFNSLVGQTQGQSFLQAFQMLKGAGQITEIEGQKATDAISRLRNQRLSDNDYLTAITDLENVVKAGLDRARQQAGRSAVTSPRPEADAPQSFTDQKQVIEAIQGGKLKIGDEIMFNGERMRIDP